MGKIRIQYIADKPKEKRKKPEPYLYEQEARELLGRYFVAKNGVYYMDDIYKDRASHEWLIRAHYVSTSTSSELKVKLPIIRLDNAWAVLRPHKVLHDMVEITKDDYNMFVDMCEQFALKIDKMLNICNIAKRGGK